MTPAKPACPPVPRAFRVQSLRSVKNLGYFIPKGHTFAHLETVEWEGRHPGRTTAEGNLAQTVTPAVARPLPPAKCKKTQMLCRARREWRPQPPACAAILAWPELSHQEQPGQRTRWAALTWGRVGQRGERGPITPGSPEKAPRRKGASRRSHRYSGCEWRLPSLSGLLLRVRFLLGPSLACTH